MTEPLAKTTEADPSAVKPRRKFPVLALGWTILVVVGLLIFHSQTTMLNEQYNLDPAMPWLFTALLTAVTWLVWLAWSAIFLRSWKVTLALLLIPTAWWVLFYPDFGGDANMARVRSRIA